MKEQKFGRTGMIMVARSTWYKYTRQSGSILTTMGTHPRGLVHLQGPHIETTRPANQICLELLEEGNQVDQVSRKINSAYSATMLKHYTAYHPYRDADRLRNQEDEQQSRSMCPHRWESVKD
jgi:hypothetical protein